MATKIEIWNAALTAIGQKSVVSETENTASSRLVLGRYDNVRQGLLVKVAPTVARKRAKLLRLGAVPAFGWAYYYQLPSGWLTNIGVWDNQSADGGEVEHQLEDGLKLAADAEEIYIKYIGDVTDPNIMAPLFREAVSAELAAQICIRSNELSGRAQAMKEWARKALTDARSADSQSNPADMIPESTWITARYGRLNDRVGHIR